MTSGIMVTDISDHFGIFATIQLTTHNAQKQITQPQGHIIKQTRLLSCTDLHQYLT